MFHLCSVTRILAIGLVLVTSTSVKAEANAHAALTIKEVMESIIVPASDTLWAADDPQTEEEWQILEDAAIRTIAARYLMDLGGTGPDDNRWVKDPSWQAFSNAFDKAARDSLDAARDKNIDRLLDAGYELYPPCEGCHLIFNPGVVNQ
ncbi:MAG: hypothetical protein HOL98_13445 [Gammaproteobacteria bacterium]|jgi:hypothetical protein|nr:hypothetical protein [Gammaproteobacteria bacterium]MBT5204455.1 hypothetical protein [Gammaproteobacteria bacterium]MBT5601091.1 hypothetical protein [Gammaproteobacteria bacterium]